LRVSFSRKGFDSSFGRSPSPILPDGTLLSLPIPESVGDGVPYQELSCPGGRTYADVMRELDIPIPPSGAHADPDVDWRSRPRLLGWTAMFGQGGGPQTHLDTQGFAVGDLFLFYGWFRHTEMRDGRLRWRQPIEDLHVIWSYLFVGKRWDIPALMEAPDWALDHPHVTDPYRYELNNVVWVAASEDRRQLDPSLPNSAILRWNEKLRLTAPGPSRSVWRLPHCFWPEGTAPQISGHTPARFSREPGGAVILRTKSPGQEYVTNATDPIKQWIIEVLRSGLRRSPE
jgi:Nucleotide modification associated domain 3